MRAQILPEALEELLDAAAYLDAEAPGLGDQLIDAFEAAVADALAYPLANQVVEPPDIRKKNLGRFRYAFLYRAADEALVVSVFFHLHRHPAYWRDRLRERGRSG